MKSKAVSCVFSIRSESGARVHKEHALKGWKTSDSDGYIAQESWVRANLTHVEPVDIALEVHDQSARANDKHSDDQVLPVLSIVDQRR